MVVLLSINPWLFLKTKIFVGIEQRRVQNYSLAATYSIDIVCCWLRANPYSLTISWTGFQWQSNSLIKTCCWIHGHVIYTYMWVKKLLLAKQKIPQNTVLDLLQHTDKYAIKTKGFYAMLHGHRRSETAHCTPVLVCKMHYMIFGLVNRIWCSQAIKCWVVTFAVNSNLGFETDYLESFSIKKLANRTSSKPKVVLSISRYKISWNKNLFMTLCII